MKLQLWRDRRHRDGAVRKMRLAHSWTKDLGRVEARQLLERGDGALLGPAGKSGVTSPVPLRSRSPRIVRLSPTGAPAMQKSPTSNSRGPSKAQDSEDWITPAPRPRSTGQQDQHGRMRTSSPGGNVRIISNPGSRELGAGSSAVPEEQADAVHDMALQVGSLSINQTID